MIKTKYWIAAFALLFLLSLGAWVFISQARPGRTANIYVDGQLVRSIDLTAVDQPYTFDVECPGGVNTIAVEPGRIAVCHADCPDGTCVAMGWLEDGAAPIVCLPHRLVIQLEGEGDGPELISR